MADAELFEVLPGQPVPVAPEGAPPRLRRAERRRVELRAVSLDALIPDDHRVRLVWRFVEGLDPAALYGAIKAVEGRPGHPPADPRVPLALWLYATVEGVGSARALARLCQEHVAHQWLRGGVGVNAKTLADFRVGHGAVLERLLADGFAALVHAGVASLDRVAQDGMRVRAEAGAASFRRHTTLLARRDEAAAEVRRLRAELAADPGALGRRQAAARRRAAEGREARVEAALAVTAAPAAERRTRATEDDGDPPPGAGASGPAAKAREKEPRASTTDAEARVMKMADGGFRPAYNAQFAADTGSGAVAGVAVDNAGSDMGELAPMSAALAACYGRRPGEHLADGGFAKLADIAALARAGVTAYVPVPAPRHPGRDRHEARPHDAPEVATWRARMGTDEAKVIHKERAATAECVDAQARNRGLTRLLVRGLAKVEAVAAPHALTHNMLCTWRLLPA